MKPLRRLALGIALAAACGAGAQAAVVSWLLNSPVTRVGQVTFVHLLYGQSLGTLEHLGAFDLEIQFDPSVLQFDPALSSLTPAGNPGTPFLPDQLGCPGLPSDCTPWGTIGALEGQWFSGDDTINMFQVSLAPEADLLGQATSFLLARLAFEGAPGAALGASSLLSFTRIDLADEAGGRVALEPATTARITIALPQPGVLPLLAAGLIGLALPTARRRSRRAAQAGAGPHAAAS